MRQFDHLYRNRPINEEQRELILSFFDSDKEYDEHNEEQMKMLDTSHLTKTKLKTIEQSTKRWERERNSLVKHYKTVGVNILGVDRTWLQRIEK